MSGSRIRRTLEMWPLAAGGLLVAAALVWSTAAAPAAAGGSILVGALGEAPATNPPIEDSCGTNVVLVLDASGSISSSNAVDDVRDAGTAFLDALADTGSTARVLQFGTVSAQLAGQQEVTAGSLASGGAFRNALNAYYNPKPPRPSGVNLYEYRGSGSITSASSFRQQNSNSDQYTNWDQSLAQAAESQTQAVELVVYITDGDPTAYDFGQPGDPFPDPNVAFNTARGAATATTLDRAVEEANVIKNAGTRMLAVGVGAALNNAQSRTRLTQISGPLVVRDSDIGSITSINQIDVALVNDFDKLAQFLRSVVSELCSPSLSIRKLAQSSSSSSYEPAPGWDITVTPDVAGGGTYEWILPDTDATQRLNCFAGAPPGSPPLPTGSANDQAPRTCRTDGTGLANFQWEPNPEDNLTSAEVAETLQPGFTAGRPGANNDWKCTLKNDDGTEESAQGDFGGQGRPMFTLDVDPQQIITCNIYNSFVYLPAIDLQKTDTPVQVRGGLGDPDSTVTSTFTVTNTGNAALSNVELTDDTCTPVYLSGDTGNDGILDPAESWTYTCDRVFTASPGRNPVTVTNTARVGATDPTGTAVSDTASATVRVFSPAISLTKSASVAQVNLGVPTSVTYSYLATNIGNMPLSNVTIDDTLGPSDCTPVTPFGATAPISLAPGGSQEFRCTTTVTAATTDPILNTAEVTATPGFPIPNPPGGSGPVGPVVTDRADAVVNVVDTNLVLTKAVDQSVVFPNTAVVYTYTITNPGNIGLVRTDAPPPTPADPRDGWVVDTLGPTGTCSSVVYVIGDVNDNQILDPLSAETWTYTCTTTLSGSVSPVVNTAVVTAAPVGGGAPLTRRAQAVVEVVDPVMTLTKVAVRPVVLDDYGLPGSPGVPPRPIAGPDVPLITPAAYEFTVRNEGNVPIRDVSVTDTFPSSTGSTVCTPTPVPPSGPNVGDLANTGVLDPGEVWEYDCVVPLTKADDADGGPGTANVPAVVTNVARASGTAFVGTATFPVAAGPVSAPVLIISPIASLTKTPCTGDPAGTLTCSDDLVVRPDTDVTYRYLVRNTGDTTLNPVALLDDKCADITYRGGDTDGDGLIEGGVTAPETWEFRCTSTINPPGPVVNTAEFYGVGPLGNLYLATATATVRVFDPAINLVKTARETLVPAGTAVTYDFAVTNVGESTLAADDVLAQIELVDVSLPALPGCATPIYVSGDVNSDGLLPRDTETWQYVCTATVTANTTNLAIVGGTAGAGLGLPTRVFDASAAYVAVFNPAIDVTKTANPTEVFQTGPVTYSYAVRNTGDVPLADVKTRITDDRCAPVIYVSGDEDLDDLLDTPTSIFEDAADETWIFTCTTVISVTTVNTVTVTGTPTDPGAARLCGATQVANRRAAPCDVTDTATATVTVDDGSGIPPTPVPPPTVVPPPSTLPATGLAIGAPALLTGVLALAAGLGLVRLSRRRRLV